jgi:hypothetical protein
VDQSTGNVEGQATESQNPNSTANTQNSGSEKTFTQEEVNAIITKRLSQVEKKYQGIDLNEYQQLKSIREQQETEQALKRQEFDKVLGQVKSASEQRISALTRELETIKIDGALIAEASARKAVAPDKVAALLRNNLKLGADGSVEVVDSNGQVRYDANKAQPLGIGDLVDEFLKENSFFVAASPAGSGARPGQGQEAKITKIDISSLDMKNPEHRKVYAEYRKTAGFR